MNLSNEKLLKRHKNFLVIPLKYPHDFNWFWFSSEPSLTRKMNNFVNHILHDLLAQQQQLNMAKNMSQSPCENMTNIFKK